MTTNPPEQPRDVETRLTDLEGRVTVNTRSLRDTQVVVGELADYITTLAQTTSDLKQSTANLRQSTSDLLEISKLHDRQFERIWDYLRNRNGGSSPS